MKKINKKEDMIYIFETLKEFVIPFKDPLIEQLRDEFKDISCFEILIATILSLRSRDPVTFKVYSKLRNHAKNSQEILKIPLEELENIIKSIGFYHNKAKTIRFICQYLIDNHNGEVPKTHEELLKIKGVGRKTANLVMTMCYEDDFICVDTHVHRLTNRLFLKTKDATQTEFELMKIFPKKEWNFINLVLVKFGQNHCLIYNPKCKSCPVYDYCNFDKKKR
ncbi:MAG: endonuclease III [Candidatus Nanoarchaeia archaeon]|nr:endonuclease III [Candidatus Nanoarchaeia archaeon]